MSSEDNDLKVTLKLCFSVRENLNNEIIIYIRKKHGMIVILINFLVHQQKI